MTATDKKEANDFFHDPPLDPVAAATGNRKPSAVPKKKAGFYLPVDVLNRFDRKFHELKLAGHSIENKSAMLEAALGYALDDLDRGPASTILRRLSAPG